MFEISNLNDYEFELICRDIMERLLDKRLYTFPRGRDGGIDICDSERNPKIIIQAKHYNKSKYYNLKRALDSELNKVKEKSPEQYYICTSLELTKSNKDEIVSMFYPYMTDISFVIDSIEIQNFLEDETNKDIIQRHYKLWLSSTSVLSLINNQNVFIDCDELLLDIENHIKLFVETRSYHDAIKQLIQDGMIVITGAPGVGKSTLSKMLLFYFVSQGFAVRYTTDNNIGNIKKTLSLDPMRKEIVLLDDFLGQHYLKIKDSQPTEIKSLISFIKRNSNKKIILNSRITILNEAKEQFLAFNELMENHEKSIYLIDLDDMTQLEKAKILYSHIYFNELPRVYFLNIKEDKNYFKIVAHKNYNPRIIEYVLKKRNYACISPDSFFAYIKSKLDNPEDVWRDEFQNRIEETDRTILYTVYSLTDTVIEKDLLERSFDLILRNTSCDYSIRQFRASYLRLNGSLLKGVEEKGYLKIGVVNPSVNDFLKNEISNNPNEQLQIIKNIDLIEPMIKIAVCKDAEQELIEKVLSGELLKLKNLNLSPFYYYMFLVDKFDIYNESISKMVELSFERMYENVKSYKELAEYGRLITRILSKDFVDFYKLHDVFNDETKIRFLLEKVLFYEYQRVTNIIIQKKLVPVSSFAYQSIKEIMIDKMILQAQVKVDEELGNIVSSVLNRIDKDKIYHYRKEGYNRLLEQSIMEDIDTAVFDIIENNFLPEVHAELDLNVEDFDSIDNEYFFDIDSTINSLLHEEVDDYDHDDRRIYGRSEVILIQDIFER